MERNPDSHKGDNGKVMIVAGSELFHGAPILCALAAEYAGVDLVYPFMPPCHADTARTFSLNFILQPFEQNMLTNADVKKILRFSEKVSCVVIGPGLGTDPKTQAAIKEILTHLEVPTVVDADALQPLNRFPAQTVLTPHRGEFREMTGEEPTRQNVQKWANHFNAVMVVKGPQDIIAHGDTIAVNETGNALMTVGGSGDALAGLIGGLMALGHPPFEAAKRGAKILGQCGDNLARIQGSLRAIDLCMSIPHMLLTEG